MEMSNNMLGLISFVTAMGLVGVVVVDMMTDVQNAEAKGVQVPQGFKTWEEFIDSPHSFDHRGRRVELPKIES